MFSITGVIVNSSKPLSYTKCDEGDLDPHPGDIWLFTDPRAKKIYSDEGRLAELEMDVCTYVMYNEHWNTDEIQFKHELNRLLNSGKLAPAHAFGHLSPHPTIYRAMDSGVIQVSGEIYRFDLWDDVVFVPWLERLSHPCLAGPLRIGHFDPIKKRYLSPEAFPQVAGYGHKDFAILHRILYNPNRHLSFIPAPRGKG
jgi:hypothetical protein